MTVPPRKPLRRVSVSTGRSHRRNFADQEIKREICALSKRLDIEPPRVVWTSEARAVLKQMQASLAYRQQPTLEGLG